MQHEKSSCKLTLKEITPTVTIYKFGKTAKEIPTALILQIGKVIREIPTATSQQVSGGFQVIPNDFERHRKCGF